MSHKSHDLALVAFLTPCAAAIALSDVGSEALRALVALPLVLLFPGYALTAATFPGAQLSRSERWLCASGMSLCIVALGALLINLTPWGITPVSWVGLLGGITLIGCAVAWLRRQRLEAENEPTMPIKFQFGFSASQVAMLALALVVTVGALALARYSAEQRYVPGVTQLWMLPAAHSSTLQLGIRSDEQTTTVYRLRLMHEGTLLHEWASISLQPGQRWQEQITVPEAGKNALVAQLFVEQDSTTPYREVIWKP